MGNSGGLSRNSSRLSVHLMLFQRLMTSPVPVDNRSRDRLLKSGEPRLNYAQIMEKITSNPQKPAREVGAKQEAIASL